MFFRTRMDGYFAAIWFAERMSFAQFLGCAFIALALLVNRLKFLQHRV